MGLSFIIASLIIWPIKDPRPKEARHKFMSEVKDYLLDIKTGFRQFRLPKLWLYVPLIITLQGLFYTAGWGLLRLVLFSRFGFSPFFGSMVLAVSSITTVAILALMHRYARSLSEKRVLTLIGLSAVVSLLVSVGHIGAWGLIVILFLYAGEHTLYPFMSEILNNHAPDEQRATVLSVANFLRTLPYVALAPLIGYLNTRGHLNYFLVGWSFLILGAVTLYVATLKRDAQIKISA
jgi:nitrate reductase NapE component